MSSDRKDRTAYFLDAPHDVPDKASRVRRMFNGIAPRYELINSLFSLGRDEVWRRRAVELAAVSEDDEVLDVACGTGSFARALTTAGAKSVIGCDFAHEMLTRAAESASRRLSRPHVSRNTAGLVGQAGIARAQNPRIAIRVDGKGERKDHLGASLRRSLARDSFWCEADALRLPFRSGSFSITSCAFGVRNFQDLDAGLTEMFRVLRPGGRAVILEFSRPASRPARGLYECYSRYLMPMAATLISGDRTGAYRYLPRSVVSFVSAEQMIGRLRRVGFARATATPLTMGIVTVYVASRD